MSDCAVAFRRCRKIISPRLQEAEKAMRGMLDGYRRIADLKTCETSEVAADIAALETKCYEALDDDLNTPIVLAHLFEACSIVNRINDGNAKATADDIAALGKLFGTFLFDILGMADDVVEGGNKEAMKPFEDAVDLLLNIRAEAKSKKDWATSDAIRDGLAKIGFNVKDTKDGFEWSLK